MQVEASPARDERGGPAGAGMTMQTQIEALQDHEARRREESWLVQPMGRGRVLDLSFGRAMDQVRRMAAHLAGLGLPPRSQIALFSKNTAWWLIADLAIWMAGHVSVPLYPTLAPDTIRQILEHSESRLIFVGKLDGFAAMETGIPERMPRIAMPLSPAMDAPRWDDILSSTEPLASRAPPAAGELATIIYTSGSTGVPKGVMHSFGTMCASRGFVRELDITVRDRMLSYLPLAHALERTVVETLSCLVGHRVFFTESLETFLDDVRRARPTIFVSVPRLWLKLQQGVLRKMPAGRLDALLRIPVVRRLVQRRIVAELGLDRARITATGSAPIPGDLLEWWRRVGLEILEGYGTTENFTYSHLNRPGEVLIGSVGRPHDDVEHRINEAGEVEVKAPTTMLGYFKAPELSHEAMTADGFLKTGDLGVIDARGRLTLTGRVKELFKTSKGKYVSPGPIENALMACSEIDQACVAGAGLPRPFAMVVLAPDARQRALAGEREAVTRQLERAADALNARLDPHERLETLVVLAETWTIENGMLTPTLKLRRAVVEKRYADRFAGWCAAGQRVVWA
jgi:long-subunit acyl-CoA synthetase (AMP-forming)